MARSGTQGRMVLQVAVCEMVAFIAIVALGNHVPQADITYRREGDLLLGGLFPIHETSPSGERCGQLREHEALHRVEAMAFAVELINNRTDILRNITLGFEIRDTCLDISKTQVGALKLLPSHFTREETCPITSSEPTCNASTPIVAAVGTESSSTTMSAAQLLGLDHLPVVSFFATSDDLSDQAQYPYFLRVVPPDRLQVQAMLEIVRAYGWIYVHVVYSDDSYGTNAYQEIVRVTELMGVCHAGTFEIRDTFTDEDYDDVVLEMMSKQNAKAVILFVQIDHANNFLSAMKRNGAVGQYQILGSDGWGMSIGEIDPFNRRAALGSLKTHLFSGHVEAFEDYFLSLTPDTAYKNPWFSEFWNSTRNCSMIKYGTSCFSLPGFSGGSAVGLVMDAVYTIALGLSDMHLSLCGEGGGLCPAMTQIDTQLLFEFMKNVSFIGYSGNLVFDGKGDAIGKYVIENIQLRNGNYELVKVGFWSALQDAGLMVNTSQIVWGPDEARFAGQVPSSYCSDPCVKGQISIPWENQCCWSCYNCSENAITVQNQTVCVDCNARSKPDNDFLECIPVEVRYMKWNNPLAIMLNVMALSGLIFCTVIVSFYIYNGKNMLIKASSRELCYIILVGIYLSYVLVFAFIAKPSMATCLICRMMLMLSFTIIYAPLLTRVNRIYRIFESGRRSVRRPGCISPGSQVTIALFIIVIQVVLNCTWLIVQPPAAEEYVVAPQQVELACNFQSGEIIASLSYNFVLLALCSVFAFKTRKVPHNYNESRFIALCVYTVLVIWIGFIASYFVISDSIIKVVVLSLAMICNGTITLCFMFLSKLYAIYFEKDIVFSTTTYEGAAREGATIDTSCDGRDDVHRKDGGAKRGSASKRSAVRPTNEEGPMKVSYIAPPNVNVGVTTQPAPRENFCSTLSGSSSSNV